MNMAIITSTHLVLDIDADAVEGLVGPAHVPAALADHLVAEHAAERAPQQVRLAEKTRRATG